MMYKMTNTVLLVLAVMTSLPSCLADLLGDTRPLYTTHWPVANSYMVNSQTFTLNITKDQQCPGLTVWSRLVEPSGEGTRMDKLKFITCLEHHPVYVNKWTHIRRRDCGEENNFKTTASYKGYQEGSDGHGSTSIIDEVKIETCYVEPTKNPVPLDCQGKWYNKPTWQFAYNVTIPFSTLYEPESCGKRFKMRITERTPYKITKWDCTALGNTGAARIIFQTEPLTHQRVIYSAVLEYSNSQLVMGPGRDVMCPFFNQVVMPPWDGYCSVDDCKNIKFRPWDVSLGE